MNKTGERYAHLYAQGRVDAEGLARVMRLGLITQEEYEQMTAPPAQGDTDSEETI